MKQIKIGTCIPGNKAEIFLENMKDKGFETFSINFHMELEGTDLEKLAEKANRILENSDAKVSTIGYYCNPIQYPEHRKNLEYVIANAPKFGATCVSTFAGAYEGKPVDASFDEFGKVFRELADMAEEKGVKLGIENCLMDGSWQSATCNIGFHPDAQLRKWCKKIVHIHGKDATIDRSGIKTNGIFGKSPFVWHRLPGFGDTNWTDVISILCQNGYEDDICIEGYHDPVYSGEWEMTGQLHSLQYLKWCRGGEFAANPWEK